MKIKVGEERRELKEKESIVEENMGDLNKILGWKEKKDEKPEVSKMD